MKILFLTDNFPPEVNAPATRTFEHCREWVKQGANVTVITGAPNFPQGKIYEGYRNCRSEEEIEGIRVIRVRTYIAPNKGTFRRALDYLSFYFSSVRAGRKLDCDVILGTSPQFFTALAAKRLSRIKKKPWIMEVRDIWPESIKAVNAVSNRRALGYLEKKERECYAAARGVVCVTQGIYNNLLKKGVPENKLRLFTNGANTERFSPRGKDTGLLERLNLNGKKVIGYLGTMGMSHKLDFILNSMKKINDPDIHFLLIGEGAEKEKLVRLKNKLQLKNVTILNGISKQEAPAYLSLMDVALVHLRKTELFQGALPSKIFENAAMGKPLLLGLQGEAERLIAAYPAGLAFEPENEADFLEKMHILLSEREFYDRCVAGAMKLAKDFDRSRIARDMLTCIREWSKQ